MNAKVNLDREALAQFCRKWQVRELSLFGSALRDDFNDDSDFDFLVTFEPGAGWSLLDFSKMRDELSELTGREVDLVVKDAIKNPYRRREILSRYEILYAA